MRKDFIAALVIGALATIPGAFSLWIENEVQATSLAIIVAIACAYVIWASIAFLAIRTRHMINKHDLVPRGVAMYRRYIPEDE